MEFRPVNKIRNIEYTLLWIITAQIIKMYFVCKYSSNIAAYGCLSGLCLLLFFYL